MADQRKAALAHALDEGRWWTHRLLDPLDDDAVHRQHHRIMSPLVWDLGHIGNFEELWLLRALGDRSHHDPDLDQVYNPFDNPRWTRADLPLLQRPEAHAYLADVRADALRLLRRTDLDPDAPLLAQGYVYNLVIQHEAQHQETMLQALDLREEAPPYPLAAPVETAVLARAVDDAERVVIPGGPFWMGAPPESVFEKYSGGRVASGSAREEPFRSEPLSGTRRDPVVRQSSPGFVLSEAVSAARGWGSPQQTATETALRFASPTGQGRGSQTRAEGSAYDNERPRHRVEVGAFAIDRFPVTTRRYAEFVAADGYSDDRWWSPRGLEWHAETGHRWPQGWVPDGDGGWLVRRFGHIRPLDPREPVEHVSFFEAEAFAAWTGGRLPTEAEWEKAAAHDPATDRSRPWPWGFTPPSAARANLDRRRFGPAPVGSFPSGASAYGAEQLLGDCYEWTVSDFAPYPGYLTFPYSEYSEVFFGGDWRMLRGASWASRSCVARTTFRNWDHPYRRQLFAGLRVAYDAG